MHSSKLDLSVGLFVLAGLAGIAALALKTGTGQILAMNSYPITARFSNVGGLKAGSPVLIAGVRVGEVRSITLDSRFAAVVDLRMRANVRLPTDTIASIRSLGLIGDKYLALAPGADEGTVPAGGTLVDTESAVDIESLISRFAFGNVKSAEAGK